jgi:demethylmenaquinone methyltransferase/2-methoxy-6-polyprenyl-1,4-benzoquinol methylase
VSSALPAATDKPRFVAAMFGRIAGTYDLMNSLMTAGQDAGWRRAVADALGRLDGQAALDVGTGTGKLALEVARRTGARLVGVDFAEPMLRAGRPALAADPAGSGVALAAADALRLPFPDGSFAAVVSAFVVRNVADVRLGLAEQARVLRPGGRLVVLEITPGPPGPLWPLFRLYFRGVVPLLGRLIAGDARAYTYLPESAAAFLEPERLVEVLRAAGLVEPRVRRLGLGSVALTTARKP